MNSRANPTAHPKLSYKAIMLSSHAAPRATADIYSKLEKGVHRREPPRIVSRDRQSSYTASASKKDTPIKNNKKEAPR
jgi:hypothetical protein